MAFLAALAASVGPRPAAAQMIVQRWAVARRAAHPGTLSVLQAGKAAPVVKIDLTALPRHARIHRALLFVKRDEALAAAAQPPGPNQIVPLAAPFEPGKPPRLSDRPLPIPPPRYDCFDATDVVRTWVRDPTANHGLLVKRLPGWLPDATELEIAWAGKPMRVPRQVGGLKVSHSAGQTFITWAEIDPLIADDEVTWGRIKAKLAEADRAYHYRIYTHSRPIDARTLSTATRLARVGPLSGYNCNGRNVEYLVGQAMIRPDDLGELARDKNALIDGWHMDHPRMDRCPVRRFVVFERAGPLPAGTGLYVHSPDRPHRRYYAVVSCLDGTENTQDFSPANSLVEPVEETVGPGEPVCQGEGLRGPFHDYPGTRKVYVQWCGGAGAAGAAGALAPRPNMYFNWSVLVPPDVTDAAPVELWFHKADHSHAKPDRKLLADSIQIAPHDWPFSGWYGFNEFAGTLRDSREGYVRDHTQKRIAAFMDWAARKFPIDPDRVLAVGWDGAALTALHQPQRFAYVLIEGFQQQVLDAGASAKFVRAWGPRSAHIRDERDRTHWSWAELDKLVLARPSDPLPLFVCKGYSWGRASNDWGKGQGRFYRAVQRARQPIVADWTWAGGRLMTPEKHTGLWRGLELTRLLPVPALTGSSLDSDKEANGQVNVAYAWRNVRDEPDEFAVTVVNNAADARVDLTGRRLRRFKVAPGEQLLWEAENVRVGRTRATTLPARRGRVTADAGGLFTLRGLKIPGRTGLIVRVTRAK